MSDELLQEITKILADWCGQDIWNTADEKRHNAIIVAANLIRTKTKQRYEHLKPFITSERVYVDTVRGIGGRPELREKIVERIEAHFGAEGFVSQTHYKAHIGFLADQILATVDDYYKKLYNKDYED